MSEDSTIKRGFSALYQYLPLYEDDREFRLLQLLPLPEYSQAPLQCRMIVASFEWHEELDNYEAISYFWGDPSPSSVIEIDGASLYLPVNSEKALRRLAFLDRSRTLFLDAACINQTDCSERASQVRLMGDVYRYAQATLIYLGEPAGISTEAFANIRLLHVELQEECKPHGELWKLTMQDAVVQFAGEPFKSSLNLDAMLELFQCQWFRRVWVVQEICVASNATLIWGIEEIDMLSVLDVAWWLATYHTEHTPRPLRIILKGPISTWLARRNLNAGNLQLITILNHSRYLEATNPRDKVYGVLGMLDRASIMNIPVDYTKSIAHVFRDVTIQCLIHSRGPFQLFGSLCPQTDTELFNPDYPSWVFRLGRTGDYNSTTTLTCHGDHAGRLDYEHRLADAIEEPDVLLLGGIKVCHVEELSQTMNAWTGSEPDPTAFWIHEAARMLQRRGIPPHALARTMVANTSSTEVLSSETSHLEFLRLYHQDMNLSHGNHDSASVTTGEDFDFVGAMFNACNLRKFAIMSNGAIGLVPQMTGVFDKIVVIHGATMPMVLRPVQEEYLLLGECYVDGWMLWQEYGAIIQQRMKSETRSFRVR